MPGLMPPPASQIGEAAGMVVAAVVVGGQLALAVDGPAELAAPDDQRVVEQPALLQVRDQRGRRLIGVAALAGDLRGQVRVLVPAAMEELDEPHAALGQPAGQQAVGGVACRAVRTSGPYSVEDRFGLVREVGQLGDRGLHPVGQLVLGDPREDLGVAELAMIERVEPGQVVEHPPPGRGETPGGFER